MQRYRARRPPRGGLAPGAGMIPTIGMGAVTLGLVAAAVGLESTFPSSAYGGQTVTADGYRAPALLQGQDPGSGPLDIPRIGVLAPGFEDGYSSVSLAASAAAAAGSVLSIGSGPVPGGATDPLSVAVGSIAPAVTAGTTTASAPAAATVAAATTPATTTPPA